MGLSIDIAANTREAQRGIKDLSTTLDGVADSLDDVAADTAKGGDRVERTFRDMTKAAQDAGRQGAQGIGRLGDALSDTGRSGARDLGKIDNALEDVERQAKRAEQAVDDIGDGGGRGLAKIKGGAEEVTQEIGQNLGEAVSSVRGNLSDLGQVGQDTLGGLAATIAGTGPAGIAGAAALAAGAVGLGLITSELEKQQQEADALKERLSGAYQAAAEEGRNYIDTAQEVAEANDLMFNPERAEEWKNLQKEAKEIAVDNGTMIDANSGNLEAIKEVQSRYNQLLEEENQKRKDGGALAGQNKTQEEQRLEGIRNKWGQVGDAAQDYANKADQFAAYQSQKWQEEIGHATTYTEAVDEVGNRLIELPDGKQILIDAQTGQATSNIDKFKGDADGVIAHVNGRPVTITATTDLSQARADLIAFTNQQLTKTVDIVVNTFQNLGGKMP